MNSKQFREKIKSVFEEFLFKKTFENIFTNRESEIFKSLCELSGESAEEVKCFIEQLMRETKTEGFFTDLEKLLMLGAFEKNYPCTHELFYLLSKKQTFEKFKEVVGV